MSRPIRRDWAVILARGESRRMGRPKGLCHAYGDSAPFLARLLQLYHAEDFPVAVVTTPALRRIYEPVVPADAVCLWLERGGGSGTAASAGTALRALASRASHLWLHPVDLPDVRPVTLRTLRGRSEAEPAAVLIPFYGVQRGHPVVIPVAPLGELAVDDLPGHMRDRLAEACCVNPTAQPEDVATLISVPLTDPGIVLDYDEPADLIRPARDRGPNRQKEGR
jgi:CTP:molybdopterin cytidylyltransferase MocA